MNTDRKSKISLLDRVLTAVRSIHLPPVRLESDVVQAIEKVLANSDIRFAKEMMISPRCRVDILTEGGIAIEVKRGKPNTENVAAQVQRYAAGENVTAVVLVSERGLVHHIDEAHGKPIKYVALSKNWGIAP